MTKDQLLEERADHLRRAEFLMNEIKRLFLAQDFYKAFQESRELSEQLWKAADLDHMLKDL